MLIVIFGAGASYDSNPGNPASSPSDQYTSLVTSLAIGPSPKRPPLARELFAHRFRYLLNRYTPARLLAERLSAADEDWQFSIEDEFEHIVAEARDRATVRRQLMASRYFLREAVATATDEWFHHLDGVTNYHALVDRIEPLAATAEMPVCYLTFNWDTMLERACQDSQGLVFKTLESYISYPALKVIKLHGSVDWGRPLPELTAPWSGGGNDQTAEWLMNHLADGATPSRDFQMGDCLQFVQGQPILWPAIAIPTQHKTASEFELPDSHLEVLGRAISTATHVLVIGWRGQEAHFWKFWREQCADQNPKALVIDATQTQAESVASTLRADGNLTDVVASSAYGFTGFLRQPRELADFLSDETHAVDPSAPL